MPQSLVFSPFLVLRHPALPFTVPVSRQAVTEKLAQPGFMEALWLASPDLHDQARRLQDGPPLPDREKQQLYAALLRYLNRMRSRSTPFGLFAASSLVPWSAAPVLTLGAASHRHTRLDMHYACRLARAFSRIPALADKLLYYPNASYYQVGDQIRYLETVQEQDKTIPQHTAVTASPLLQTILEGCRPGRTLTQLYELVQSPALPPAAAQAFIRELVEAQVLTSELEPCLTGEEFSGRLLQVLERLQVSQPGCETARLLRSFRQVAAQLQSLDAAENTRPANYAPVLELLAALPAAIDRKKLFQVDLFRPACSGGVPESIRQDLQAFIPLYKKLAAQPETSHLKHFRRRFQARYGDQAIPLLEALDPDMGLGYGRPGTPGYQPLVEDLVLPPGPAARQPAPRRSVAGQWLRRQVQEALQQGRRHLALNPDEVAALPETPYPLPPSCSVVFRVPRPGQIYLEGLSGASAANLVSRFGHGDAGFRDFAQTITRQEAQNNPGVLFAELVHLPEERAGNILQRPPLRAYEIPYLAASGLPEARQIYLRDLVVSVKEDRVILYSPALKREIIPRLSTAHHYQASVLPVYRFLCDLQGQGLQVETSLDWQPGHYHTSFLPRLTCRNFILGLATWQLKQEAFAPLLQAGPDALAAVFQEFRQRWHLPDQFTCGEGDRDLLVDSQAPDTLVAWLASIRHHDTITLREFLYDPQQSLVQDQAGQPYASQFICPVFNPQAVYAPPAPPLAEALPALRRTFPPGSEWLYYKLYSGPQFAETLLGEVLAPLTGELEQSGLVDAWFFLRYRDPDPHIRLRLHLPEPARTGQVMARVYETLWPYQESRLIWKTQTCTYQRETERYGADAVALAEKLFYADSRAVLQYVSQQPEVEKDQRWRWALVAIDQLLSCFGYSPEAKLQLMGRLKEQFSREFHQDRHLKGQLDHKYRQHRAAIRQQFSAAAAEAAAQPYGPENRRLIRSVAGQLLARAAAGKLLVPLDELVASFIHLHVNRLMPAQARLHELLLYDFLYRHYKTTQALLAAPLTSCPR